ncbi:hypothetical protein P3T76_009731 [Phytophthora citrophthora]|uniref:BZIP domain-containing protein n=1 Tax=Phytophthora citrophthora TaxID=4793 RepID=A0AAD9LHI8_9STRA|nr:hypothetical protein P3T76_009731 [Phytophthora citrophthora]
MARKLHADKLEAHRLKNRECMRKIRLRQRLEVQELQRNVEQLEQQYAELSESTTAEKQDTRLITDSGLDYTEAVAVAKQLGAEKLMLQTQLKHKAAWRRQLQRILDFEASEISPTPHTPGILNVPINVLDEVQAHEELGFQPLDEWSLTQAILENKREVHHVETRLLQPSIFDALDDIRTHRMQAFGWDVVQRVEDSVMEFVFTKKFVGLNVLEIMQKTWNTSIQLDEFKKIKAETQRLQMLQQVNSNAHVFVRDVGSPSDISVFRSVFAHFFIESTAEDQDVAGTGYTLGTQSVSTNYPRRPSELEVSGKLAWAKLLMSIEAVDVVDQSTGETYQRIRWVGRTDYCSEEHAQRDAADTLQSMLRWEMLLVAPALTLVSLSLTAAEQDARRAKNREGMRKTRLRQRKELLHMKTTVVELEKQYAELSRRAEAVKKSNELAALQLSTSDDLGPVAQAKHLGAEKLQLQSMLQRKIAWALQIQRVVDFEASSLAATQQFQNSGSVQFDTQARAQAEEELVFHPLTQWDLTRSILENKRDIHHVESRLRPPSNLIDSHTHQMEAFGWEVIQRVEGSVMEFVFLKKFTNLNVLDIMHKTWRNDIQLATFRTVKAETSRLEVLQQLNPYAYVFVRDVDSPSEISIFRSVFINFLVEASKEFSDSSGNILTGTGYVLSRQSVAADRSSLGIERDEAGRTIAWANLALTTEAYEVETPATGEKYQQVVWAGKTDYCTEGDAQRNAADTLQGLLRWEMKIVAPALTLPKLIR